MSCTRVNPWPTVKPDDPVRTGKSQYPGWKLRPVTILRRRGREDSRREAQWSYASDE